jgi:hypothetical protein
VNAVGVNVDVSAVIQHIQELGVDRPVDMGLIMEKK